jgi:mitogen-activated protein kinase kinase kinase
MFHIGVATQHPPLPEPDQLSELGTTFIKQCLTIDPVRRPTATELMNHPWMLEFRETLMRYGDSELSSEMANSSEDRNYGNASGARQAATLKEQETEQM